MLQEEYLKENPNATLKEWIEYNKKQQGAYEEGIIKCKKAEYEYLNTLIGKCFLFYQKDSSIFSIGKIDKAGSSEYNHENFLYGEKLQIYPESVEYDELDELDELTKNSIIKTYNTELFSEMSKYKCICTVGCIEISEENYIKIKNSVVGTIDSSNTLIDKIIKEAIK